jgi:hypothetical protein
MYHIKSFPNAAITQGATSGLERRILRTFHRAEEPIRHCADNRSATDLDSFILANRNDRPAVVGDPAAAVRIFERKEVNTAMSTDNADMPKRHYVYTEEDNAVMGRIVDKVIEDAIAVVVKFDRNDPALYWALQQSARSGLQSGHVGK